MSREHFHDLTDRLGMLDMSLQIPLPQVFLDGQLLGVSETKIGKRILSFFF